MKHKIIILIVLLLLAIGTGSLVYKALSRPRSAPVSELEESTGTLPPVDTSVTVAMNKSSRKDNTVVLTIGGLAGKYTSLGYEVTYESQGLIKGVNSGSKPIDISGKDIFEREVYMGTCSRNVCKPDTGVKKVSVVLEFTDTSGKKSQFSKDYDL